MSDWDERKRVVSDTSKPVVIFNRNPVTEKGKEVTMEKNSIK
jgi:hypothetical protein